MFTWISGSLIETIAISLAIAQLKNIELDVCSIIANSSSFCVSLLFSFLFALYAAMAVYAMLLFFRDSDTFPDLAYFGSYTLSYILFFSIPYVVALGYLVYFCSLVADYGCRIEKLREVAGLFFTIGLPLYGIGLATCFE